MSHYLIAYIDPKRNDGEEDPLFGEFTFGDQGRNGQKLLTNVQKGDYLFFHTTIHHKRYITAFYEVDTIMSIDTAKQNALIMSKYYNPHLKRKESSENEAIAFGHPIHSFVLINPLEVNEELLKELSIPFNPFSNPTVAGSLASKLRNWLTLDHGQVELLKQKIFSISQKRFSNPNKQLSTEEIPLLLEQDIEEFIFYNPSLIGPNLEVKERQYVFKNSGRRLDLLLENKKTNELTIVEIKKGAIDVKVISQLESYIKEYKEENNIKHVKGVIVGNGVLPHFEEKVMRELAERNWKLFNYGWQFSLENEFVR